MESNYDLIIIGSGAGGGTLAYGLKDSGARILLIDRGGHLPQEDENWMPESVFGKARYKPEESWLDADGPPFQPGVHYFVGGNTKVYGAALPRLRVADFNALEHADGTSPAWPVSYTDLEPYYAKAENIYRVHATAGEDPTDPARSTPYPFPCVEHEPVIQTLHDDLVRQGMQPFHLPIGIDICENGTCIRCPTCDGFPCKVHAKSDAEVCCVLPALESPDISLMPHTKALRLRPSGDGKRIESVEVDHKGSRMHLKADRFVVSCGAVNSTALLLRSGDDGKGVANKSGLVGRNYMAHNNTAMIALKPFKHNRTVFQKTLSINDFYLNGPGWNYPLGNLQLIGGVQGSMLKSTRPKIPLHILNAMAKRSVDWWVMSEDLPDPENRVTVTSSGRIRVRRKENNMRTHRKLLATAVDVMKSAGYPLVFSQTMGIETNSHQCGTVRFGNDGATSVLDPYCRSHDIRNLYVVDSSFFPSSAAVNPALTIAAQALRVADQMMQNP